MTGAGLRRPERPDELLEPGLLIDGTWLDRGGDGTREHVDPSTGRVQQTFPLGSADDVDRAVGAARSALPAWRAWAPDRRAAVLRRLGELIRENAGDLAVVNALEVGTPAALSRGRYEAGQTFFEYYAGWVGKAAGDSYRQPGSLDVTLLEPVGVVASVITWNHPLANIQTTVAPALAAGCTVVLKPPEQAPFAALRFGRLAEQAGLPAGVVNVVPGGPRAGQALVSHPGVDKVCFVGGTEVGRAIQAAAAPTLKPLVLELGGKSATLVFDDADLDRACRFSLLIAANTGQGCTIPTRLLVQRSVYERVVDQMARALEQVVVGDPFDADVAMGPLIDEAARERVLGAVRSAVEAGEGAVVTGGRALDRAGWFVEPTLVRDVDPASDLARREVFGPVLAMTPFDSEEEGVALANDTEYGLAGYVHTADAARALRVASALEVGNVGINGAGAPAGAFAPFGGVKQSGFGKVGGLAGLLEFTRVKNVMWSIEE